jgi:signal transduction histidine kinase
LQAGTLRMSFQPLRMDMVMRDMVLRAKSRTEDLDIQLDIRTPGLQIPADPTRLAQVFENLLTNAMKYAPGAPITISLEQADKKVHIIVHDDGPGIAPEHLANLFKRFYRVPTNSTTVRGTGLGLFICRQIVRAHGGEIHAESAIGKGTTFHIFLPLEQTRIENNVSFGEGIS